LTEIVFANTRIRIVKGDITEQDADAIVNAANSSLMGGGGVDGAIHRKGGPTILEECEKVRRNEWREGLPVGETVITSGGNLKARFVIHTVGPMWNGGSSGEEQLLAKCYSNSLKLAAVRRLNSIAFPALSTGAFGYPFRGAAIVAIKAVQNFLANHDDTTLREVIFVLFTSDDYEIYKEILQKSEKT
jgi:O-acetyl-ADP-ribose deacetylase